MNKPKFSWEKVTLSSGDIKCLDYLIKHFIGTTQKNLSDKTNLSIGAISKILWKLNKKGLIYHIEYPVKIFRLVPERKEEIGKLLTGYNFGKNERLIFDAHAFVFESEIKELPDKFLKKLIKYENWIEFNPNNWKGYKIPYLDGSIKFHKTNKGCKAFFYFRTFAKNPAVADMINTQKFLEKKELLENKYNGLRIGDAVLVAKCPWQEVAILRDPIAVKAIKFGIKHKRIEDSHRIGGEWEEKGSDAVDKIQKIIKFREILTELSENSYDKLLNYAMELKNVDTKRKGKY